jgi:hypothetical protein
MNKIVRVLIALMAVVAYFTVGNAPTTAQSTDERNFFHQQREL